MTGYGLYPVPSPSGEIGQFPAMLKRLCRLHRGGPAQGAVAEVSQQRGVAGAPHALHPLLRRHVHGASPPARLMSAEAMLCSAGMACAFQPLAGFQVWRRILVLEPLLSMCRWATCWAWGTGIQATSCWTDTAASCCTSTLATALRPPCTERSFLRRHSVSLTRFSSSHLGLAPAPCVVRLGWPRMPRAVVIALSVYSAGSQYHSVCRCHLG